MWMFWQTEKAAAGLNTQWQEGKETRRARQRAAGEEREGERERASQRKTKG